MKPPLDTPLLRESVMDNEVRAIARSERFHRALCLYVLIPLAVAILLAFAAFALLER